MKRVGIYAGTFDPVHDGHVTFALEAIERCKLDKVFFLVEPRPRHKQGVKALEHRIAMVQLAIDKHPKLGLIILDQARFSVLETWPVLQQRFSGSELSMLLGDDVFSRLSHWPQVGELVTSVKFIVGTRHATSKELDEHLDVIGETRALKLDYSVFPSAAGQYTSSTIRHALRQGKAPEGVPANVLAYIRDEKLYTSVAA